MPAVLLFASPGVHLPLTLLLVFGAAKLLADACERFGQPGVIGEIIAGILLGPSVLHLVKPDEILATLSEMGVLFLLFRVGLEVESSELWEVGGTAFVTAVVGVVLPLAAGWAITRAWGATQIEAIFTGAAMVATSVGITAQVLASKGLLEQRASKVILAAAVIDDVLGLLVLAFVSNLAESRINIVGLLTTAALAGGFTLLLARYGSGAIHQIMPRIERRLALGEAQFNLALIVLFGLSVAAAWAGIAAIVGAFLAGMAMSETVNQRVQDLAHGISELLVPFFLAGIGLNLDVHVFSEASTIGLTVLILVAAIISKMVGCGLGALRLGWKDAVRVGLGMIPRGEVGMVVAQLGLSLGVIDKSVYAAVVAMAVLTTVIAPPMLASAFRGCAPGPVEQEFTLT